MTGNDQIKNLLWALKPLDKLSAAVPFPHVIAFLLVALNEGQKVGDYARIWGVDKSRMYRHLYHLGKRSRSGKPGLNLVKINPHPSQARHCQVVLTEKGRHIAEQIFQAAMSKNAGELSFAAGSRSRLSK